MATSTEAVPARPDAGPRTLSAAISRWCSARWASAVGRTLPQSSPDEHPPRPAPPCYRSSP